MDALPRWIFFWLILLAAPAAFADGIILAAPAAPPPDMPQQRALIVYRDGVEKLVVESSFRGEGNEFAWILPVPSAPIEISKASAGLFTTLEVGLQPYMPGGEGVGMVFGALLLVWGVAILHYGRFAPFRALYWAISVIILIAAILLPALSRAREAGPPAMAVAGVRATDFVRVGSYEVQTLEADTPGHLNQWLAINGYQTFPENGASIVADYIRQGWKFVAARLHRNAGGFSRPHPLGVSFHTDSPVYPMRLTQLAGSNLHLDLFVIARQQMRVDNMATLYSDRFLVKKSDLFERRNMSPEYDFPVLKGGTFGARMGLPSLVEMAGGGCVITWLQADLANAQLDKDFSVINAPNEPTRPTVHTVQGAMLASWSNMTLAAGIVCAVGSVVYTTRKSRRARVGTALASVIVGAILVVTAKAATFGTLKSVERLQLVRDGLSEYEVEQFVERNCDVLSKMNRDEVEQYFRSALEGRPNGATGEPLAFEEAPGDFVIDSDENGIFVRTFNGPYDDEIGAPHDIRITAEPPSP